jgi:hypothetical protein
MPIKRQSQTADFFSKSRTFFLLRFSAWWTLVYTAPLVIYLLIRGEAVGHPTGWLLQSVFGILGLISALAAMSITLGMLIYLFMCDSSPLRKKFFWLIVFFWTAFFGTSFYFFSVYKKQFSADRVLRPQQS